MFRPFRGERQWRLPSVLALAALVGLAGCSSAGGPGVKTGPGPKTTYLGSIAADDPQAVDIARQILMQGGSAADAMVAAGLTLGVTSPARAGLGGGGICLIHRPDQSVAELDFLPQTVPGSAYPVPGMVRGLSVLRATFGRMRWQQDAVPAERLALDGVPASTNLTDDLATAGRVQNAADGTPLRPGSVVQSRDLASFYSALRLRGDLDFYQGVIANRLAAAGIPAAALAAYKPVLTDNLVPLRAGDDKIVFTHNAGGAMAARAWNALAAQDSGNAAARMALAVKSVGGADQPTGGTAVVISDATGLGIGCAFTMGRLWGSGQTIGDTGVLGAAPVDAHEDAGLVAAVEFNGYTKALRGVVAGAGGTLAPAAVAATTYAAILKAMPLDQALAAPRVPTEAHGQRTPSRVEAAICPGGLPNKPDTCAAAFDPRGSGFATIVVGGL
ncbi:MAG TPA: gamma-glutamyltransferase [Stellaceae bacterium]|nr:gamma-glutamyltransferase [Stellaceae bacterium]